MDGVRFLGTGSALPETILTNAHLEKMVNTTDEWIMTRTGIKERRICLPQEATSDLCIAAAKCAIENSQVDPASIDLIVVATCTPDHFFPSVSCLVQGAIGASQAKAFDVSAACSGFIYGLGVTYAMLAKGLAKRALLIGADALSKFTDWSDRSTSILFGDGAGAVIIDGGFTQDSILSICLGADGSQSHLLTIPGGGARSPIRFNGNGSQSITPIPLRDKPASPIEAPYIKMDGKEVFKLAVIKMASVAQEALQKAHKTPEQLSLLIPHQANLRIMDAVARRLKFPKEKVFINVQKYGNLSAATTIVALDEAHRQGRIQRGDLVELIAFGAGMTWGAAVIKW